MKTVQVFTPKELRDVTANGYRQALENWRTHQQEHLSLHEGVLPDTRETIELTYLPFHLEVKRIQWWRTPPKIGVTTTDEPAMLKAYGQPDFEGHMKALAFWLEGRPDGFSELLAEGMGTIDFECEDTTENRRAARVWREQALQAWLPSERAWFEGEERFHQDTDWLYLPHGGMVAASVSDICE